MTRQLLFFILLLCTELVVAQLPNINACGQDQAIHVVILGSSTAAGTGPTFRDSTWVNRYRAYLQTINNHNQVTNLARGGTTTYQIMPSWFVAPMGRPATDTSRNVTQAVALQPDAIIINMPSNDVANNITLQEQLNNYRVMIATADSAQIPVWVCTTQPRNFGSAAQRGLQVAAKDSILAEYGVMAIDFWSGFADSSDFIKTIYDSGDGVHLNDAAHEILFTRVAQKALPNVLADTTSNQDLVALDLSVQPYNGCGDTLTTIDIVVGNLGPPSILSSFLELSILNQNNNANNNLSQVIPPIVTCGLDTLNFVINTSSGVHYLLEGYIMNSPSPNTGDTTNSLLIQTIGRPYLQVNNSFQCAGDSSQIPTQGANALLDRVYWYNQASSMNPFYTGQQLPVPPLANNQTFYAQVARGPFYFFDHLATSTNTNIDWNGVAFDIVAKDSLVIDSLETKLATLGLQSVKAYYKLGSHVGYLNTPNAWTVWDSIALTVSTAGAFYVLDVNDLSIATGDTLGVYLHLQNPSARLSYNSNGRVVVHENNELEIIGGSGVSHTFGNLFSPRNWAGVVHYHYGSNPSGICQSPRLAALVTVSDAVALGNDTTIMNGQTVVLAPTGSYTSYQWSNGSNSSSVLVDSSWAILGQVLVYVTVTDANGCVSTDSIQITFSNFTHIPNPTHMATQLYPNPSTGTVVLQQELPFDHPIRLVNAQGMVVWVGSRAAQQTLQIAHLPKGIYWLVGSTQHLYQGIKVVLY